MHLRVSPLRFALIVALATLPALNASAIVFDDGGVHVIDTTKDADTGEWFESFSFTLKRAAP